MRVRVFNVQYHYIPQTEAGGFIIEFPDIESLRLDHKCDSDITQNITSYFEKQERFDWDQAKQEYKNNREVKARLIKEETEAETIHQNTKT